MFSLEIYSRFQKNDLTDGKKIAGTGTIDPDGTVGRIGGIDQKVVAADKSGAKVFFAPNDPITDEMKKATQVSKVITIQQLKQRKTLTPK